MSVQLELSFDSKVTLQADGSYRVDPGKLVARKVEDWRYLSKVLRDDPESLPYKDRHMMVDLFKLGKVRGRQKVSGGWWEVEMNSVREYLKGLES